MRDQAPIRRPGGAKTLSALRGFLGLLALGRARSWAAAAAALAGCQAGSWISGEKLPDKSLLTINANKESTRRQLSPKAGWLAGVQANL